MTNTPFMGRTMYAAAALDAWLLENVGEKTFNLLKSTRCFVTGGAALAAWWDYEPGDIDIIFEEQNTLRGFIAYLTANTSYHLEVVNDERPSRAREAVLVAEGKRKLDLLFHPEGVYDFNGTIDLSCCRVWYSVKDRQWFFHSPLAGNDICKGVIRALQPHKTTDARIEKYTRRAAFILNKNP